MTSLLKSIACGWRRIFQSSFPHWSCMHSYCVAAGVIHNRACDNLSCMMIRWAVPTSFQAATTKEQICDGRQSDGENKVRCTDGDCSCDSPGRIFKRNGMSSELKPLCGYIYLISIHCVTWHHVPCVR